MIEQISFAMAIIAGIFAWTASTVGLTLYLHNKFRSLEIAFYRGLGKHRAEIDKKLYEHGGRIQ